MNIPSNRSSTMVMVPEMNNPPAFKWSNQSFELKEFVEYYEKTLPQIIQVTNGYCGSNNTHSFSSGEVSQGSVLV